MFKLIFSALLVISLSGCWGGSADRARREALAAQGELFAVRPTIRPNPIERTPLVAIVDIEANTKVLVTALLDDGVRQWEQPWPVAAGTHMRMAILGMKPDRRHEIKIRLDVPGENISQTSEPLLFKTQPLPADFPPLEVTTSQPGEMEPGLTMFAANIWRDEKGLLDYGFIIALDALGDVVWYCRTDDRIADMRILKNGNILYQHGSYRYAYEIDILGRDINRFVATNLTVLPDSRSIPIEMDTTHHDIVEMPSGNLLTLATKIQLVNDYPTSELNEDAPGAATHVVSDDVVEFDRQTGRVIERFSLRDVLDPNRFGYMFRGKFWKDKYNDRIGGVARDWSHANALLYLPEENAIVVSVRHQDCIVKIDWKTKEILWILGVEDGWGEAWQKYLLTPKGDWEWFYHQHSPQFTSRGTMMLYDNGNYRARPFQAKIRAPNNRSRVLEMRIDEEAMTVEQVYVYDGGDQEKFYCPFYCDADWLPKTDNILVTDGGHVESEEGIPRDKVPGQRQWARIFEITRDGPTRKVFEVKLDSGMGSDLGWSIYRSMKIRDLYKPFRVNAPAVRESVGLFSRDRHVKRKD